MSRSQVEFLYHILDETEYLLRSGKDLSKENFLVNEDLKRAFTRSIEIMGEASKNVSEEIRNNYSAIDWRGMARMRDKLIHHYFGVDYDLVWEVVMDEVPKINAQLLELIQKLKE